MKALIFPVSLAALALTSTAFAQLAPLTGPTPLSITLDEFGHGFYTPATGGAGTPLPPGGVDIGPGAIPGALVYTNTISPLGAVIPGDVLIMEPGTPNGPSDLIRFNQNNTIVFYSDVSPTDPAEAPADVGIPTVFLTPTITGPEFGPESGPNGADYTPTAGMPGFDPSGAVMTYHFISDLPEPGTLGLLAISGSVLLFRRRRT
jgi:hypothetical protein